MTGDGRPIRWGILATGRIAGQFAADLALLPDAEPIAIGSRSQRSADAFGDRFAVPHRHGSYQALVEDPDVDVVYVATLIPGHHAAAMAAIEAGKAVLVEKPFTRDAREATELIEAARQRGTFLMEAMWTRFVPDMVRVREILAEGVLGEIVSVTAEHGLWAERDPANRLFDPELGGSALLDLGIYPVSFASMVLGAPMNITACSTTAFNGVVDAQTSMIFQYGSGAQAILRTTTYANLENNAAISGTLARLQLARHFFAPTTFRVIDRNDEELERWEEPHAGKGLYHEAAEVGRCLREGLTESPGMPLDETLAIMATMDTVRGQIGLHYE